MATIAELVCANVGAYEDLSELRRAYNKIDDKITQMIQKRGLEYNLVSRKKLLNEARHSIETLTPINAFAVYLHDLNCAAAIPDENERRSAIKKAVEGFAYWVPIMLEQEKAGHKMVNTKDFFINHCQPAIEKADPTKEIRSEIDASLLKMGATLVGGLGILAGGLWVASHVHSYVSGLMTEYINPRIISGFSIAFHSNNLYRSSCGLYRSLQENNTKGAAISVGFLCFSAYGLYNSVSPILYG
jgi:hypothetical protein